MYEHENGDRIRRVSGARSLGAPADDGDARAQARRALQDSYDWRDDDSRAWTSGTAAVASARAARTAQPAGDSPSDEHSAAARAEARRSRQEIVRSISRTVGV